MRSIIVLLLAAIATLTACDSGEKPKSPEEVQQEAAKVERPQPGLYRTSSKIVSFEIPGMAPAEAERMKAMFSSTNQNRDYCLTQEEADKGWEAVTTKLAEGNCNYDRFNASSGTLDAKLTCQTGQGMKSTIEMKGTMTSTGSDMTMSIAQAAPQLPGGKDGIRMVAEVSSERVGDCPPGAK